MTEKGKVLQYGTFASLCIIWGSTWLAIKWGLQGVPPFLGASLRFLLAAAILLALALLQHHRLRPTASEGRLIVLFGVLVFLLDYGLIYWAEGYIASGLTAVLFATMPFSTALFAAALAGETMSVRKVLGMVLGFGGVLIIFRDYLATANLGGLMPMVVVVVAAACAGLGSVLIKRQGQSMNGIPFNALAMALGGALQLAVALGTGETLAPPTWPLGVLSILYLALLGSVLGFVGYFWLLRTMEATTLSYITLFTPVTALALGVVLDNEPLEPVAALGALLILLGVGISTLRSRVGPASVEAVGGAHPTQRR